MPDLADEPVFITRQQAVQQRIEEVEADFYAPLLGVTLVNLFPEKTNSEIVDAVLGAYKQIENTPRE